ncbi:ABC transporter substrate-binding protein [Aminobacter anthyllidis]|uniref:ABC transporter substrate-binding protein n=1 Tax=Aminobacter anthyllidis TaxID=1035067 RepID=A0A9X1AHC6_9HYPH|nr:ABC transporter substrate-binding protein [Aminobacter anthyllidis]MBT1159682.1 ABC transporter substrate-binding protein [Aminobacter anthyllidis]
MFSAIHKSRRVAAYCAAAMTAPLLLSAHVAAAEPIENTDPIRFAMNEWTSQNVLTQIAGRILTKAGYNVEYVTAGYTTQLTALASGELTASMEIWGNNAGEGFAKMTKSGEIEVVGENGLLGGGGWIYPEYVEKLCPGLPNWEALKGCASIFATPETLPQGQLIDYPPEWGNKYTLERVTALGLDFKPVSGGSEGAMLAALRSSVASKVPVLVYLWWPHPIFAELKLKRVEAPAWSAECETDPKWGLNPDAAFDCGWEDVKVAVAAWPGMKDKWPKAYKILKNFRIDNDEDMALAHAVDAGQKLNAVADTWISSNEGRWKGWISDAEK